MADAQSNCTVVVASRVPPIVADILLIYITWTKLKNWGALRNIRQSKRLSLSDILFRGGTSLSSYDKVLLCLTSPTGTIYFV